MLLDISSINNFFQNLINSVHPEIIPDRGGKGVSDLPLQKTDIDGIFIFKMVLDFSVKKVDVEI
jgi:hypothetical protein